MGYHALRWVIRPLLALWFGLRVVGEKHVPPRGPVILAANHPSQIDPLILAVAIPRRLTFFAAAELLTMPVLGALVRPFHPVPVRRGHVDLGAIKDCLARLERGAALLIFPEGKISRDGRLQPPHEGLAFIALRSGVPVIPVGVRGTYQVWPLGTRVPHRGRIEVRLGPPIVPDPSAAVRDGAMPAKEAQAHLTARVMEAIAGLIGDAIDSQAACDPRPHLSHAAG